MYKLLEVATLIKSDDYYHKFLVEETMNILTKTENNEKQVRSTEADILESDEKSRDFFSLTKIIDEVIQNLIEEEESKLKEMSSGVGGVQGYSKNIE
tara:strand:+ start:1632 stop:1922 length:291 start_codon:yes stop_codon:yes gene_type:complete